MREDAITPPLIHCGLCNNLSADSLIAVVPGQADAQVEPQARQGLMALGTGLADVGIWADGGWPPPHQGVEGGG